MRRIYWLAPLLLGLALGAALVAFLKLDQLWGGGPEPETVAQASLQSMREQARLVPFTARFVAVVTSTQTRFGLQARKTLIMPGNVRYELDLSRVRQQDLVWDAEAKRLTVTLPPIQLAGPEVDLAAVQEYGGEGMLAAVTDAETQLDQANRQRARAELLRQAQAPTPVRLARESARRAVERSFAMPLRAAGIEAEVVARFPGEGGRDPSQLDRSRRMEEVVQERTS
jgi:hypothetical protein